RVIAGHGAGAQTLSRQRMCRVLNIDIGGGTSNSRSRWAILSSPAPGRIWSRVIAGHGAGAQTLSRQRMCRVLNIDIGGGTSN
ncbi:ethanolamine utilization protein EutA, partial [Klebsiella pneumoniae]